MKRRDMITSEVGGKNGYIYIINSICTINFYRSNY